MLRALDDPSMLDRYLEIKARIAELEEELESLKGPLLYALMEEPQNSVQHRGFDILITRRKAYSYSDKVAEMERILTDAKAHEREAGIAQVTKDQAILVVRASKEDR